MRSCASEIPELKAAVEASIAGDVRKAFDKLGSNVAEVKPDNLAGAAAARWLKLSPHERENAGLMAPSHALREEINAIIRDRLIRDGVIHGPAMNTERLISRGYTNAEKSLPANYAQGDVVAFHRSYKRLGVEKGDELRVAGVDHDAGAVNLTGKNGEIVSWLPDKLAGRTGGVEVYRTDAVELREGDRIRWTRNDSGLGLVNSQTAEVARVKDGAVAFKLEDGRSLNMREGDPQLRHIDRAWASTVHAFPGPHRRYCDRGDGGQPSEPYDPENPLCGNQPRPATERYWLPTIGTRCAYVWRPRPVSEYLLSKRSSRSGAKPRSPCQKQRMIGDETRPRRRRSARRAG